jgi:hypothetical protein
MIYLYTKITNNNHILFIEIDSSCSEIVCVRLFSLFSVDWKKTETLEVRHLIE